MLNCMLNNGEGAISVNGTLRDIMADVTILIKHIYDELDEDSAQIFKKFVKELLVELPFADMDDLENMEKEYKQMAEKAKKSAKEIKKKLDELLKNDGLKSIIADLNDLIGEIGEDE